jgi:hypothetical protein
MPKNTNAIEISTDAKMYIRDVRRWPLCNIWKACAENVENVVKPPQKPTAIRRYKVFDDAGISKPMIKEPMTLTAKVASSLQIAKCVKRQVIK